MREQAGQDMAELSEDVAALSIRLEESERLVANLSLSLINAQAAQRAFASEKAAALADRELALAALVRSQEQYRLITNSRSWWLTAPLRRVMTLLLGLALALPALSGLSVTIAALTAGLSGASALGGLLLVPIAIPLLIFGADTLSESPGNAMQLLAATSLALAALSPFAAGAALRAGRG